MKQVVLKVGDAFLPQLSQIANECVAKGLCISELNQQGFLVGLADEGCIGDLEAVPGIVSADISIPAWANNETGQQSYS